MNTDSVVEITEHWIDSLVVGLNLCPFANAAKRKGLMKISVSTDASLEGCLQLLADEANLLEVAPAGSTTLLVVPEGFSDFEDYLDLLDLADALLEDLGFEGIVQLASFHPDYQFEGTDADDVTNWTNRAPFPILHLLSESSVSDAVDAHPDPDSIPENNMRTLEQLGIGAVERLLRSFPDS